MKMQLHAIDISALEPFQAACFGYKRSMLEEKSKDTFYIFYCNDDKLPNKISI